MVPGGILKGSLYLVALATLVSCGVQKSKPTLIPKSDGVLIQGNGLEIQSAFPNEKVEVVSPQLGIYKLQTEFDVASKKLPQFLVEENSYIQVLPPKIKDVKERIRQSSSGNVFQQLGCVESDVTPTPVITHDSGGDFVVMNNVYAGGSAVILSAEKSGYVVDVAAGLLDSLLGGILQPSTPNPSSFNYFWLLLDAPPGSQSAKFQQGVKFTINPDRPGAYVAALIVQDASSKACDFTIADIGATIDVAYAGQQFAWNQQSDFSKFFHIPMVQAEKAWNVTQGEDVVVAVIDSGMNYNHPDLANSLYVNTRETFNGIDDDGNGIVDDVYGYDFAFGDNMPYDDASHGTHVSGLVAGAVSGVAPGAKVLPIKALYPTGGGSLQSIVGSIVYAAQMKVDIMNLSLGGKGETSPIIKSALEFAKTQGVLVVAASGNDGANVDTEDFFLTEKDSDVVLAVSSTDEMGTLASYSNFGVNNVGIAAPGGTQALPILSTYSYNDMQPYIGYPGTSMASPIVAGVAALVKSVNKNLGPLELKNLLKQSSLRVKELSDKVQNGHFVNAQAAIMMAQSTPLN